VLWPLLDFFTLEDGVGCPTTSVSNYHSMLRTISEECRSHVTISTGHGLVQCFIHEFKRTSHIFKGKKPHLVFKLIQYQTRWEVMLLAVQLISKGTKTADVRFWVLVCYASSYMSTNFQGHSGKAYCGGDDSMLVHESLVRLNNTTGINIKIWVHWDIILCCPEQANSALYQKMPMRTSSLADKCFIISKTNTWIAMHDRFERKQCTLILPSLCMKQHCWLKIQVF